MTKTQADNIFRAAYVKAREQYGVRPSIRIARATLCEALDGNCGDDAIRAMLDGAEARVYHGRPTLPDGYSMLHTCSTGDDPEARGL